jgi:anthranilate phosphoribosyltransferase
LRRGSWITTSGGTDLPPAAIEALGGWPVILGRLLERRDLTAEEAEAALDSVLSGEAAPTQIAAFAAALRTKGETAEEMKGLVRAMRRRGEHLDLGPGLVDTCGTGGDMSGTINVSTVAAIITAAAGARVCKHGGRAASSLSGSADVLEALGVAVDLGPIGVTRCIEEVGMGFCLAPRFHPAMRYAAPVRRELGVATVFNFLGPLANPANASRQLIGVGDPTMAPKMLSVLESKGAEHAMVVFGYDGLDELSTSDRSHIAEIRAKGEGDYDRLEYDLDPADFGIRRSTPGDLLGGPPEANARAVEQILDGKGGPQRDFVLLNAGAALVVAGIVSQVAEGVEKAASVVDDGAAAKTLARLVAVSIQEKEAESRAS